MSLLIIVASLSYGIPALLCARMVAGHHAWRQSDRYDQQKPDSDDWRAGCVRGFGAALVWPLVCLFYLLPTRRLAMAALRLSAVGAQRAAIRRQRQAHVERLEREVGLR